jgi:glycosyltransferase involved in cell wall biosynthesis
MKVSILIPTIDRLPYLQESLDSARRQTHSDLEILVSDDSPARSSTTQVLALARADPRVKLLAANPQRGLYENYNYLIGHVTGDAFGILDDDDRWLPMMIATLVKPLEDRDDVIATFCDHWILSASGARLREESDHNSKVFGRAGLAPGLVGDGVPLSMRGGLSTVFALFRTSVFKQEGFDTRCAGAADLDYAIRAALKGGLYYVDQRLGEYRAHDNRTTSTQHTWMIRGAVNVLEKYSFVDAAHEQLRRQLLAERYRIEMVYVCTRDRAVWYRCLRNYLAVGGSVAHPTIGLSMVLASMPRNVGEWLRRNLKQIRRWWNDANKH